MIGKPSGKGAVGATQLRKLMVVKVGIAPTPSLGDYGFTDRGNLSNICLLTNRKFAIIRLHTIIYVLIAAVISC